MKWLLALPGEQKDIDDSNNKERCGEANGHLEKRFFQAAPGLILPWRRITAEQRPQAAAARLEQNGRDKRNRQNNLRYIKVDLNIHAYLILFGRASIIREGLLFSSAGDYSAPLPELQTRPA
jgi:hypothetical protein